MQTTSGHGAHSPKWECVTQPDPKTREGDGLQSTSRHDLEAALLMPTPHHLNKKCNIDVLSSWFWFGFWFWFWFWLWLWFCFVFLEENLEAASVLFHSDQFVITCIKGCAYMARLGKDTVGKPEEQHTVGWKEQRCGTERAWGRESSTLAPFSPVLPTRQCWATGLETSRSLRVSAYVTQAGFFLIAR